MIVYGRQGTPMPANGLEGGGAMTMQEVDQVISYLQSIQITQEDATGEVNQIVDQELSRLANADATVALLSWSRRRRSRTSSPGRIASP